MQTQEATVTQLRLSGRPGRPPARSDGQTTIWSRTEQMKITDCIAKTAEQTPGFKSHKLERQRDTTSVVELLVNPNNGKGIQRAAKARHDRGAAAKARAETIVAEAKKQPRRS
jgi:hypothetical protein